MDFQDIKVKKEDVERITITEEESKQLKKKKIIEELKNINSDGKHNEESGHILADELLLEYIDDDDIRNAYEEIFKWYS